MFSVTMIEEGYVLLEEDDGTRLTLPAGLAPQGVKEGDLLERTQSGYVVCEKETELRRREVASLLDKILRKEK